VLQSSDLFWPVIGEKRSKLKEYQTLDYGHEDENFFLAY
jgi:hypothetical protein